MIALNVDVVIDLLVTFLGLWVDVPVCLLGPGVEVDIDSLGITADFVVCLGSVSLDPDLAFS